MPVRQPAFLRRRYRALLSATGMILMLCGGLMLVPLLVLFVWPEESRHATGFLLPSALLVGMGWSLWKGLRPSENVVLTLQEGGVIVLLAWTMASLFGAWPFAAVEEMGFTLALFEAVSGWTTTGLSVVDVERAPHLILLWRSVMQMAGGAGLAIIMLAAIIGPVGPALSTAEGRSQQLVPHVRHSARLVMGLYLGYIAVGIPAYWGVGMNVFDAINHTLAALSTGGFSTHSESIGYWNSPAVEGVTLMLMLAGSLNFATAYLLLRGRFRAVGHNGEVRLTAVLAPVFVLAGLLLNTRSLYPSLEKGVRVALFETVSALTTTGFSTVSYGDWNATGILLLVVLMLIGGGTGSTAGGLKQSRVHLLGKALWWELRHGLLPRRAVRPLSIWEGEQPLLVDDAQVRRFGVFLFLYLATFLAGVLILTAYGYGFQEAFFECASALGTVGLSVGVTSVHTPAGVLWTEIGCMLLGRLEFFVVFVSLGKVAQDLLVMLRKK